MFVTAHTQKARQEGTAPWVPAGSFLLALLSGLALSLAGVFQPSLTGGLPSTQEQNPVDGTDGATWRSHMHVLIKTTGAGWKAALLKGRSPRDVHDSPPFPAPPLLLSSGGRSSWAVLLGKAGGAGRAQSGVFPEAAPLPATAFPPQAGKQANKSPGTCRSLGPAVPWDRGFRESLKSPLAPSLPPLHVGRAFLIQIQNLECFKIPSSEHRHGAI